MKKYKVEFYFNERSLCFDNPIDEEEKKFIENAFKKGKKLIAGKSLVDLSKCLFVLFRDVV